VMRGAGLSGGGKLESASPYSRRGSAAQDLLEHVGHHERYTRVEYRITRGRVIIDRIAIGIPDGIHEIWFFAYAAIVKRRVCAGDFEGRNVISSDRNRQRSLDVL